MPTFPILGESFLSYWLEHLSGRGIREAGLVTMDDPEELGDPAELASRWGIDLQILQETRDLTMDEVCSKYRNAPDSNWAPPPLDLVELNHLPGLPDHSLFSSYASFFRAVCAWLPGVTETRRIGMRELQPGVWAGRRARISGSAQLHAPCWLGDNVQVGKNAIVGPFAFLEDRVVVEDSCEVTQSWVGPDTLLGSLTRVEASLAWGSTLVDWETGSFTTVPDRFLMCSLAEKKRGKRLVSRKAGAASETSLTRPIEAVISIAQKLQG